MKPVCDIGKKPSDQTGECFTSGALGGSLFARNASSSEGPHILGLEADLVA